MADDEFDYFFHYDSTSQAVSDNKLPVGVPAQGAYWICLSNVNITYSNGVTPDAGSGFLVIDGTEEIQSSGICFSGAKSNRLWFPIAPANSTTPSAKTYNKILLRTSDTIALSCYNNANAKLGTARIVATITSVTILMLFGFPQSSIMAPSTLLNK